MCNCEQSTGKDTSACMLSIPVTILHYKYCHEALPKRSGLSDISNIKIIHHYSQFLLMVAPSSIFMLWELRKLWQYMIHLCHAWYARKSIYMPASGNSHPWSQHRWFPGTKQGHEAHLPHSGLHAGPRNHCFSNRRAEVYVSQPHTSAQTQKSLLSVMYVSE